MKNMFVWMQHHEGWKAILALVYALICIFDFIIIPSWIGLTRVNLLDHLEFVDALELGIQSKMMIIEAFTDVHEPYTLKGGGLFHLSFGALLTGSAISKRVSKKEPDQKQ